MEDKKEKVVLVSKQDEKLGLMDKFAAHKNPGTLHRAISVLLWRERSGEKQVLIQKRSTEKPLWPLFWTDTCSTHPVEGEGYEECAKRRLREEMGIEIEEEGLELVEKMYYQADYDEEFSEHELDGLLIGKYDGDFLLNKQEVVESKWVEWGWLVEDLEKNRDNYAPWFILMAENPKVKERFR